MFMREYPQNILIFLKHETLSFGTIPRLTFCLEVIMVKEEIAKKVFEATEGLNQGECLKIVNAVLKKNATRN
jgi:hypothetical protein